MNPLRITILFMAGLLCLDSNAVADDDADVARACEVLPGSCIENDVMIVVNPKDSDTEALSFAREAYARHSRHFPSTSLRRIALIRDHNYEMLDKALSSRLKSDRYGVSTIEYAPPKPPSLVGALDDWADSHRLASHWIRSGIHECHASEEHGHVSLTSLPLWYANVLVSIQMRPESFDQVLEETRRAGAPSLLPLAQFLELERRRSAQDDDELVRVVGRHRTVEADRGKRKWLNNRLVHQADLLRQFLQELSGDDAVFEAMASELCPGRPLAAWLSTQTRYPALPSDEPGLQAAWDRWLANRL